MKTNSPVKIEHLIFVLLICVGIYTRLLHLNSPLLDTHSWRQTQTAMFARNFYRNGMNIFKPQIDWDGSRPGYIESEFQLYPFIVALVYKLFGMDEKYGRLVAALFFTGSMFFLFLLSRFFLSERASLLVLFFFVVSPLNIFFSRTFMPESTMLFFMVGTLYFFIRWSIENKPFWFWLSCAFAVFSFLVKIPSLHIAFVLFFLTTMKYDARMFTKKELWFYLIISLSIPAFWYMYAHHLGKTSGLTENIWSVGADKWGNLSVWLDPRFYDVLIGRITFGVVTFPGIVLAVFGAILAVKQKEEYAFHIWFLSVILYFYVTAYGNMVHSYYQLPLVPVACYFAGKGCDKLFEILQTSVFWDRRAGVFCVAVLLAYCCLLSYRDISPAYQINGNMLEAAYETQRVTPSDTLIIVCDFSFPEVLYYSDRKGWHINPKEQRPDDLGAFIQKGARYLVVTEAQYTLQYPAWKSFLAQKMPLRKGANYAIYKL